jgi:hypothetical protein
LEKIFGDNREKVTERQRKLHKAKQINLCSSPYIVTVLKSRRIREMKNAYKILEWQTEKDNLGGTGTHETTIQK